MATMLSRALGLACALALAATTPVAAGQTHTCFGQPATIVGTDGRDRLVGTADSDVIVGLRGVDSISGRGGDDYICAGRGRYYTFDPEWGENVAHGDQVDGGPGDDSIDGGRHLNFLDGNDGDDFVIGRGAFDSIWTHEGDDTVDAHGGLNQVLTGSGNDTVTTGDDVDDVQLGRGHDVASTGAGDDVIVPQEGDDDVDGGEGRDHFDLSWESCGTGCRSTHKKDLHVDLLKGTATGLGEDTVINVEDVTGSYGSDTLLGNHEDNLLGSHSADDPSNRDSNYLNGRGGDDELHTNGGPDLIKGGEGFDILTFGYEECDVRIELPQDLLTGCEENEIRSIEGAEGTSGEDVFIGNDADNSFIGFSGLDKISGNGGSDYFLGGVQRDVVRGGPGHDTLRGGSSNDLVRGGRGDDSLFGERGDDSLWGDDGVNSNDGGEGADSCSRPGPDNGAVNCERENKASA